MQNVPGSGDGTSPRGTGEFSLAVGGPLHQLWRRCRLSGEGAELLHRRVIVMALLAWLPLLLFAIIEGHAWGQRVKLTFLQDVEVHVRLLIAIPLLMAADVVMHRRIPRLVELFIARGLIPADARPRFDAAIAAAVRLRNSVSAELLLLVLVYGVGVAVLWRTQVALDLSSWYGVSVEGRLQPSAAGWWLGCVSLPMFQFLVLRWYFRLFVWARLLWQVSRIDLQLVAAHPDRSGGLAFLSGFGRAFAPVLLAQGTVAAGMMANRIFYEGAELLSFKVEMAGTAGLLTLLVLGPTLVFTPQLLRVGRKGKREYGTLAQQYVREFNRKWLSCNAQSTEPLIGSADIQSLADMGNGFELANRMRPVPFGSRTALQLALLPLLPAAPLLLTTFSAEQLLERVMAAIF
jgi:hypothetical protein